MTKRNASYRIDSSDSFQPAWVRWALTLMMTALIPAAYLIAQQPASDGKLRIIAFGAHPDDCELQASGTGALWAAKGHHVKFVSVTNGYIGHWREAGGPLALRRKLEVEK